MKPEPKKNWEEKIADLIEQELEECTDRHEPKCHAQEIIDFISKIEAEAEERERNRVIEEAMERIKKRVHIPEGTDPHPGENMPSDPEIAADQAALCILNIVLDELASLKSLKPNE